MVKYWRRSNPAGWDFTDFFPTNVYETTVEVAPRLPYVFQVRRSA